MYDPLRSLPLTGTIPCWGKYVYSSPSPASTPVSFGTDCFLPLLFSGPGNQLLQYKADINAVNEHGNVPLHYACFWGQDQVAEVSTQALSPGMGGSLSPSGRSGVLILSCEHCRVQGAHRICTASEFMVVVTAREVAGAVITATFSFPGPGG